VFCLLVVLVKLSVLAKWLARKTPLRKPNRSERIVSRKSRPKNVHDFLGLLYCFIVLLCICVVFCPYVTYFPTVMARYSLFVLKMPLNPEQTNKHQTGHGWLHWCTLLELCLVTWQWIWTIWLVDCNLAVLVFSLMKEPRASSRVERIDPLHFLAGCRKMRLNQALSVLSLSICFLLFIRATFCVPLVCVCMCSVSWLYWLSGQYFNLPSDWLERLLRGSLLVVRRLSPQGPGWRVFMTFSV